MKRQSDPVTRIRSTFWQDTLKYDTREFHSERDDETYAAGYAAIIDRKGGLGFATGDMDDETARDLCIEMVGMIVALVDNVPDDTTVRVLTLLSAVFNESNLLRRDLAVRIAHAQWGDEAARLTLLLADADATDEERLQAGLTLQAMTLQRMREEAAEGDE